MMPTEKFSGPMSMTLIVRSVPGCLLTMSTSSFVMYMAGLLLVCATSTSGAIATVNPSPARIAFFIASHSFQDRSKTERLL